MPESTNEMRRAPAWIATAGAALLAAGCASQSDLVAPCCYQGEYTMASLGEVSLVLEDGRRALLREVFPRLAAHEGIFGPAFPFDRLDIARAVYGSLVPVLPRYDANRNGWLETPELAVLYVREAARGLGTPVDHVATSGRVDALVLSRAEIGGLVRMVEARSPEMTAAARALFRDLVMAGWDLRTRGSENDGHPRRRPPGT